MTSILLTAKGRAVFHGTITKLLSSWKNRAQVHTALHLLNARGIAVVGVACVVGALAAVTVTAMSWIVQEMHWLLFGLERGARLSAMFSLSSSSQALVPVMGGVLLGLTIAYLRRRQYRTPIDPIEANALYGGRLSATDTAIVAVQTIISSGFGASVGLEAAYTQSGSGLASRLARILRLRRNDVRILVGCGAGGAIAAAFGAPLTGAFYGFELIIGVYSVANVAPVMAAAVTASLTASYLGGAQFPIEVGPVPAMTAMQYLPYLLLGFVAGAASIAIMQLVTVVEKGFSRLSIDAALRPAIGGCLIGALALITPQVLSSGHGALHRELAMNYGLYVVAELFVLKLIASAVSLGSGFRGGLFFASLFLGALLGKIFAEAMIFLLPQTGVDPMIAAVVGMTSLAVGVVGAPLTMTFLALESSGNLALTGVVLGASIVSAVLVRETFGYSFSTWRFHLRGETIRSAHDVSWTRNLTVERMMREDVRTLPDTTTIEEFRKQVPLGAAQRVIVTDADKKYAGMLLVAEVYGLDAGAEAETQSIRTLAKYQDTLLVPSMNVKAAADIFARSGSEELPVVDNFANRRVVGLLTEAHLLRRYAEELDKARKDLSGES
ncbi:chloride channel protein, CIC family [Mesorhizobium sp. YR577]|nr:chloride channel protein, CIC family [Mesorhizobium sp. YR577]